jgi:predicted RNase H-like nuclease
MGQDMVGYLEWERREQERKELEALRKVARAAIDMRQRFGDEYEVRFASLDDALDAWSALFVDKPGRASPQGDQQKGREK